jgi:hypothetical protein
VSSLASSSPSARRICIIATTGLPSIDAIRASDQ